MTISYIENDDNTPCTIVIGTNVFRGLILHKLKPGFISDTYDIEIERKPIGAKNPTPLMAMEYLRYFDAFKSETDLYIITEEYKDKVSVSDFYNEFFSYLECEIDKEFSFGRKAFSQLLSLVGLAISVRQLDGRPQRVVTGVKYVE